MKFSAKNPRLRKAANRWQKFYETPSQIEKKRNYAKHI